jgi:hypothetical protein
MKKNTYLLILALYSLSLNLTAQNNTVSAGGDAEGSNGSISFTVGQVVYTSAEGSNGSVNQGVQQPYDIDIITGIKHEEIELTLYPNPTLGQFNLSIADSRTSEYSIQLFDAAGRLLLNKKQLLELNSISLESYATGTYVLSVFKKDELIKSFRIVRNY